MIRKATVEDLASPYICKMGIEFFDELKLPGKFKPATFIASFTQFMALGIADIFVADVDSVIVGALGCIRHPDIYDGELVAQELFWFMTKEARAGITAIKLYYAFESWAVEHNCARMVMGTLFAPTTEALLRMESLRVFYTKMGFTPVDVSYIKSL